jgi:glycine cleavage system H protein
VSDLFAPLGGTVTEVNSALADNPALVNASPFGEGWMIKLRPSNAKDYQGLMSHEDYEKLVEEQHA